MTYNAESTHHISGSTITVTKLTSWSEYHVRVDGEKYEVFRGLVEDGQNPDLWYTEIGGVIEGPYPTAEDLIAEVFLTEDGL